MSKQMNVVRFTITEIGLENSFSELKEQRTKKNTEIHRELQSKPKSNSKKKNRKKSFHLTVPNIFVEIEFLCDKRHWNVSTQLSSMLSTIYTHTS